MQDTSVCRQTPGYAELFDPAGAGGLPGRGRVASQQRSQRGRLQPTGPLQMQLQVGQPAFGHRQLDRGPDRGVSVDESRRALRDDPYCVSRVARLTAGDYTDT